MSLYALAWFALAAGWLALVGVACHSIARPTESSPGSSVAQGTGAPARPGPHPRRPVPPVRPQPTYLDRRR